MGPKASPIALCLSHQSSQFNQLLTIPLDIWQGSSCSPGLDVRPSPGEKLSPKEWVADLQKELRRALGLCREHISSAQRRQKASYDRDLKTKYIQYEPGARVMLLDPTARGEVWQTE